MALSGAAVMWLARHRVGKNVQAPL
jgi:hypothetical protein